LNLKEAAKDFLNLAAAGRVVEAYEKYVANGFIHHNQYFKGDRETLLQAMKEAARENPATTLSVEHSYLDGDTVITHSLVKHDPSKPGIAVVHIFKFKNNKVIELWDLGQPILPDSPNKNGPF
jgi:predicted SnoaL-like aldol condensation-catalyzing enzyme